MQELIRKIRKENPLIDKMKEYSTIFPCEDKFICSCIFCKDKAPSVVIDTKNETYQCFSCKDSGDIISLTAKLDGTGIEDAIKKLGNTKVRPKSKECYEVLFDVCATIYKKFLYYEDGEVGLKYFKERGLTDETIAKFQLGMSPYDNRLFCSLRKWGFKEGYLRQSGLFGTGDNLYNPMEGRVTFPIWNENSEIIGFGGRRLDDTLNEAKYVNSSESELFKKKENMYALNFAKETASPYFILCEGYMDVISLHQSGFTEAVASLGTSLTRQQVSLMKKYKSEVVICYDSDSAGINASIRAISMLEKQGLKVKIISCLPYKDVDELIQKEGKEGFLCRINNAIPSYRFLLNEKMKDITDIEEQISFLYEFLSSHPNMDKECKNAIMEVSGFDISHFLQSGNSSAEEKSIVHTKGKDYATAKQSVWQRP